MENVPDMLNFAGHNLADEIRDVLRPLGYETRYTLLNAAFYGVPQMEKQRQAQQTQQQAQPSQPAGGLPTPGSTSGAAPTASAPPTVLTREGALAASPRVVISNPPLSGEKWIFSQWIRDRAPA